MPTIERKIHIDSWSVLKVIVIFLALGFAYLIRNILALLFAALFLAALIHPAASYLAKKRIPKGITVLAIYLLLCGIAILIFGLLVPPLIDQSSNLIGSFGKSWNFLTNAFQSLQEFSTRYGFSENLEAGVQSIDAQIARAASRLYSTVTDVFGGLVGLVIVLVMAYYMVVQEEEARNAFDTFVPERYREISKTILMRVEEKMSHWLIGQLALCVIIGALYYIGLRIIGVNSALVLALFGGFTEFIPYLGPILGAIPIVLLALTQSPFHAVLALIVVAVIQQLEGQVIVPKVMQHAVGLNPLASIVALLIGAQLFGIAGALLSIPVATAVSVVLSELYRYSRSDEDVVSSR